MTYDGPWWVEEVGDRPPQPKGMRAQDAKRQLFWVLRYYGAKELGPSLTVNSIKDDRWMPIRCPFHQDQHPSASVNFRVNRFRCHSCDAHGDAIDLVMREECLSFKDALTWITEHFSGAVPYGLLRTSDISTGSGDED